MTAKAEIRSSIPSTGKSSNSSSSSSAAVAFVSCTGVEADLGSAAALVFAVADAILTDVDDCLEMCALRREAEISFEVKLNGYRGGLEALRC